jgi:hypothetical protein
MGDDVKSRKNKNKMEILNGHVAQTDNLTMICAKIY